MPEITSTATHVYTKRQKPGPLDPLYDGPFPIVERLGDTSLKIQVGTYATGAPRIETRHWRSRQPAKFTPLADATRPTLGRPRKHSSK